MSKSRLLSLAVGLLLVMFMAGCSSGGGEMPVEPLQEEVVRPVSSTGNSEVCLGIWQCSVDPASGKVDAVFQRSATLGLNAVRYMEHEPYCTDCIRYENDIYDPPFHWSGDIVLIHPIIGLSRYTAFDVRGVVYGPEVVNADGYTEVMNPAQYWDNDIPQDFIGYMNGLMGTPLIENNIPDEFTGLAGYKYFAFGLTGDDYAPTLEEFFHNEDYLEEGTRGAVFPPPIVLDPYVRHFDIDWTNTPGIVGQFQYAVYANYADPLGNPPYFPGDFPPEANSAEAVFMELVDIDNSLWFDGDNGGGTVDLIGEVWDWVFDINQLILTSPVPGEIPISPPWALGGPGSTDVSYLYFADNVPCFPTAPYRMDVQICVEHLMMIDDAWYYEDPPDIPFNQPCTNCFRFEVPVCSEPIFTAEEFLMGTENDRVRATDPGKIDDFNSVYDTASTFLVINPVVECTYDAVYQYYVSTDPDEPEGSPMPGDGWVSIGGMTPGNFVFTFPWFEYASIAPDDVYLFFRAWDPICDLASDWIRLEDGGNPKPIHLSRVVMEASDFSTTWSAWTMGDMDVILGFRIDIFGFGPQLGYSWTAPNTASDLNTTTFNNNLVFRVPDSWEWPWPSIQDYCRLEHHYTPFGGVGTEIFTYDINPATPENDPPLPGTIVEKPFDSTGVVTDRYFRILAWNAPDGNIMLLNFDDIGIYEDP